MAIQVLRRIAAVVVVCAILIGIPANVAFSESVGFSTKGYSWWDNQQGYRFSVYDYTENRTVKSIDIFSKKAAILDPLSSDEAGGTDTTNDGMSRFKYVEASYLYLDMVSQRNIANVRVGTGCKFDYLDRYYQAMQSGMSFLQFCREEYQSFYSGVGAVANSRTKSGYSVYSLDKYTDPDDPIAKYDKGFMPISQEKADNFNKLAYFTPNRNICKELLRADNITMAYILAVMGFSVDDSLMYFDSERYVLIIEPIFWFYNKYFNNRGQREYFYGTITEWAIYDQATQYSGYSYDGVSKSSIRNIMGRLISLAGPISTINSRSKFMEERYGEILNNLCVINENDATEYLNKFTYTNPESSDEEIFRKWAYDIMSPNSLFPFFIDIVGTNTEFTAGEEAILSFVIGQQTEFGDTKTIAPDIRYSDGDINNLSEDDYGLKLTVKTSNGFLLNGSRPDIKSSDVPTITLTCDGMPEYGYDSELPYNTTLCWTKIKVPNKTGVWKIGVTLDGHLYDANDSRSDPKNAWDDWYDKGNGIGTHNGYRRSTSSSEGRRMPPEVYFELTIRDSETQINPSNPKYSDSMPAGFTPKTVDEAEASLPPTSNTASWSYWKLTDIVEDGVDEAGEPRYVPQFDWITESLSLEMGEQYYPCTYGNLPGAEYVYHNGRNLLKIRSGYGFGVKLEMNNSGTSGSLTNRKIYVNDTELDDKLLARQFYSDLSLDDMSGSVKLPEFEYGSTMVELVNLGGTVVMKKNPFSKYYDTSDYSKSDYSRVHFTPVWYPDGEYNILIQTSLWTPRGKLYGHCFNTILIDGSVYDDWYVTRKKE